MTRCAFAPLAGFKYVRKSWYVAFSSSPTSWLSKSSFSTTPKCLAHGSENSRDESAGPEPAFHYAYLLARMSTMLKIQAILCEGSVALKFMTADAEEAEEMRVQR